MVTVNTAAPFSRVARYADLNVSVPPEYVQCPVFVTAASLSVTDEIPLPLGVFTLTATSAGAALLNVAAEGVNVVTSFLLSG